MFTLWSKDRQKTIETLDVVSACPAPFALLLLMIHTDTFPYISRLLSFGKFLELMIYSKGIWTWSNTRTDDSTTIDRTVESQTRGCLHQGPHSLAKSEEIQGPLEHTRNVNPSLVRHFVLMRVENGTSEVTFRRDLVGVTPLLPNPPSAPTSSARVFEIVGPRMQIRSRAGEASKRNETTQNVLKEDLKREMARFWESIDKRLDSIIVRALFLFHPVH